MFVDQKAFEEQDPSQIAYEVESYFPVPEGTEGGLFFGITRLQPGMIGNEYMMTKGHSHIIENRAEFYWGIEGEGMLFMDKDRNMRAEKMFPGSFTFISKGFHCLEYAYNEVQSFPLAPAGLPMCHNYEGIT